jgi:hypothetical protein
VGDFGTGCGPVGNLSVVGLGWGGVLGLGDFGGEFEGGLLMAHFSLTMQESPLLHL